MATPRKKNAPASFDIHRTLPAQRNRLPIHRPQTSATSAHQLPQEPIKPSKQPAPKRRRSIGKKISLFLILLLLAALAFSIFIGIWDGRNIAAASKKMFGSSNLVSLARGGSLKTDSNSRVNVLIVGYSADQPGHQGADLTDSILLLSMNRADHTGYMLSIPRDLYVAIPGNGYGKINSAYEDGGMSLLEQIVGNDFGISINYYAIIDYSAVRDIVNALNGIAVKIQSSDSCGLYDGNIDYATGKPLVDLANGVHTLSGEQALDLTRARGDPPYPSCGYENSDYTRTQNQRLVFAAIKAKLNWKLVLDPRKNSQILNAVADNIKTDLQIAQARPLFGLFNSIPSSKLRSVSLNSYNGQDYYTGTYYDGDTVSPAAGAADFSQIQAAVQQLDAN